jgi:ribosomal protein L7/L12
MEWVILLFALGIFVVLVVSSAATTARIQSIERKLNALLAHHGVNPTQGLALSDRVKELAADPRRKIEAIKVYREETGAGLAESKEAIEAYQLQMRSGAADRPTG